jgi:PPK2 family polyphosphate:nucleotide phosphotransferase
MKQKHQFDLTPFEINKKQKISLKDFDPIYTDQLKGKKHSEKTLAEDIKDLANSQELLWASKQNSLLLVFQAMDAAGKDGTIKHVMSGINPQGCDVFSFKQPTEEERLHHFLWRPQQYLPPRGKIAIFNRSYYEEVLVVKVHPEILTKEWIPSRLKNEPLERLWKSRYNEINEFEERVTKNGVSVIKFFLHLSKDEQKRRFLKRLNSPERQWKFSVSDLNERNYWDEYQTAFEEMLSNTSTEYAPWYVIPADNKWFMRALVADIITNRIEKLDLRFPTVSKEQKERLLEIKTQIENE